MLWKFRIAKMFCSYIQDDCHLEISDLAETLWEALWGHGDSELLNHSVPISKMAAIVAILKHKTVSDSGLLKAI